MKNMFLLQFSVDQEERFTVRKAALEMSGMRKTIPSEETLKHTTDSEDVRAWETNLQADWRKTWTK